VRLNCIKANLIAICRDLFDNLCYKNKTPIPAMPLKQKWLKLQAGQGV
jgi:hypothetical protein